MREGDECTLAPDSKKRSSGIPGTGSSLIESVEKIRKEVFGTYRAVWSTSMLSRAEEDDKLIDECIDLVDIVVEDRRPKWWLPVYKEEMKSYR